jgi:hypothetical protein
MPVRLCCPNCGAPTNHTNKTITMSAIGAVCKDCGSVFKAPKTVKKGRSDNQIRSRDQEKKAARRYGGHRQPGSGASSRAKGDFVDEGRIRGECKFTRASSFSLKLTELVKLEKEATSTEIPIFEIQFQSVHPAKTYVVLPAKNYQSLIEELESLRR